MNRSDVRFTPHPEQMNMRSVAFGQYSTAGAKNENQDFHGALHPEGVDLAVKGVAVAVADGISTSKLGATAAETAVKSFLSDYYCTSAAWSVRTAAERVITAANSWMFAQNSNGRVLLDEERETGLVCTFSALVIKSRSAHIFHIGDARIARLDSGGVEALTEPHRISLGGGQTYLGRALGINRNVEIDYRQVAVQPGDLFILSTDGVHEHLGDRAMARIVAEAPTLDDAARQITDAAAANGSLDNLTVQLVRIESLPDGELTDLTGQEAELPPAPLLRAGEEFEGYTIIRQLHASSRSHVYLARDGDEDRPVALKVLSTELALDEGARAAMQLEEWVMRRIAHQNVLRAAPQRGARSYLFSVSEYVEGPSLLEWIHDHARPDLTQVRDIVRQIASGLLAMHRREMVHRDVRPHNVIIDGNGTAKIIDFGSVRVAGIDEIAPRESEDAAYAGTLQYSAPELYRGHPATPRSDLYSLGVIAYQMLTGKLPYGTSIPATASNSGLRRMTYVPATSINPDVPPWMDGAIARAVSLDPVGRYEELSEFTFDLAHPNQQFLDREAGPLLTRNPLRTWQIIAALLAVALLVSVATHSAFAPDQSPQTKETKQ
ncbi:MAG: bifunctional protein-serine/threonine kinase/phosphatase [Novosphingobium sp.]|nr:bifunctional protein-serine/threonine kinase/phosphatase [Novosphingobium sp.]